MVTYHITTIDTQLYTHTHQTAHPYIPTQQTHFTPPTSLHTSNLLCTLPLAA